jgi:hypothetical protein
LIVPESPLEIISRGLLSIRNARGKEVMKMNDRVRQALSVIVEKFKSGDIPEVVIPEPDIDVSIRHRRCARIQAMAGGQT